MYKFSIFFKYVENYDSIIFVLGHIQYRIEINLLEKKQILFFINKFMLKSFSKRSFNRFFNSLSIRDYLFDFLLSSNIILSTDPCVFEVLQRVKLTYNPSILTNNISQVVADKLCIKQHLLGNKQLLIKPSGIIFDLLKERKTYRSYKNYRWKNKDILYLLYCMYGNVRNTYLNDEIITHKTTPSGGSFYPLKIYLLKFNKQNIKLFEFDGFKLQFKKYIFGKKKFFDSVIIQKNLDIINALGLVVITSNLEYFGLKYGAKAYPLSLLEGGHVSQNFVLACQEKGYGTCELGGIYEDMLFSIINNTINNKEIFINSILFGKI